MKSILFFSALSLLFMSCSTMTPPGFHQEGDAGEDAAQDGRDLDMTVDDAAPDGVEIDDSDGDEAADQPGDGTEEAAGDAGDAQEEEPEYACTLSSQCDDENMCNGPETCDTDTHTCRDGEPLADGTLCEDDPRSICLDAACVESECGDGFVDEGGGELCEPSLDPGCRDDCTYECVSSDECLDENMCNGEEWCDLEGPVCSPGENLANGTECAAEPRRICLGGTCLASVCGDEFVDTGGSEQCEGSDELSCITSCGTGGHHACDACKWTACISPPDLCNGEDDDCDDLCDEDFDCCLGEVRSRGCERCGTQQRTCGDGCAWSGWGDCMDQGDCEPPETSGCETECGTAGTRSCGDDCSWGDCVPPAEICNGEDDDCDGLCDELSACCALTSRTCEMGEHAECTGTQYCSNACDWGACLFGGIPINNTCAWARDVSGGGTFAGSTCGASNNYTAGCGGSASSPDVVFRLVLEERSVVEVDLCTGTTWDTVLHMRSGSCEEGPEIACDDDGCGGSDDLQSRITRTLEPGTYYIFVDGFSTGRAGPFTLNVSISTAVPPVNNDCEAAIDLLSTGEEMFEGDTSAAVNTRDATGTSGGWDVWYKMSFFTSEVVYFDLLDGEGWDAVIEIYSGSCDELTPVASSDNACETRRPQLAAHLEWGDYYVVVDGKTADDYGSFALAFNHSYCAGAAALPSNALPTTVDGTTSGAGDNMSGTCGGGMGRDFTYFFTLCPGQAGHVSFTTCSSPVDWDSLMYFRDMKGSGSNVCGNRELRCAVSGGCMGETGHEGFVQPHSEYGLHFISVDGVRDSAMGRYALYFNAW